MHTPRSRSTIAAPSLRARSRRRRRRRRLPEPPRERGVALLGRGLRRGAARRPQALGGPAGEQRLGDRLVGVERSDDQRRRPVVISPCPRRRCRAARAAAGRPRRGRSGWRRDSGVDPVVRHRLVRVGAAGRREQQPDDRGVALLAGAVQRRRPGVRPRLVRVGAAGRREQQLDDRGVAPVLATSSGVALANRPATQPLFTSAPAPISCSTHSRCPPDPQP